MKITEFIWLDEFREKIEYKPRLQTFVLFTAHAPPSCTYPSYIPHNLFTYSNVRYTQSASVCF